MATQNGVPFFQVDEVQNTARRMSRHFSDQAFYSAAVPTYYGGIMTFAWGSDDTSHRSINAAELEQRYAAAGIKTRYYTPEIHLASFALPAYVVTAIEEAFD
jgi:spermidine synthase